MSYWRARRNPFSNLNTNSRAELPNKPNASVPSGDATLPIRRAVFPPNPLAALPSRPPTTNAHFHHLCESSYSPRPSDIPSWIPREYKLLVPIQYNQRAKSGVEIQKLLARLDQHNLVRLPDDIQEEMIRRRMWIEIEYWRVKLTDEWEKWERSHERKQKKKEGGVVTARKEKTLNYALWGQMVKSEITDGIVDFFKNRVNRNECVHVGTENGGKYSAGDEVITPVGETALGDYAFIEDESETNIVMDKSYDKNSWLDLTTPAPPSRTRGLPIPPPPPPPPPPPRRYDRQSQDLPSIRVQRKPAAVHLSQGMNWQRQFPRQTHSRQLLEYDRGYDGNDEVELGRGDDVLELPDFRQGFEDLPAIPASRDPFNGSFVTRRTKRLSSYGLKEADNNGNDNLPDIVNQQSNTSRNADTNTLLHVGGGRTRYIGTKKLGNDDGQFKSSRFAEGRAPEARAAEARAVEARSIEARAVEARAARAGNAEARPVEARAAGASAAEVRGAEASRGQVEIQVQAHVEVPHSPSRAVPAWSHVDARRHVSELNVYTTPRNQPSRADYSRWNALMDQLEKLQWESVRSPGKELEDRIKAIESELEREENFLNTTNAGNQDYVSPVVLRKLERSSIVEAKISRNSAKGHGIKLAKSEEGNVLDQSAERKPPQPGRFSSMDIFSPLRNLIAPIVQNKQQKKEQVTHNFGSTPTNQEARWKVNFGIINGELMENKRAEHELQDNKEGRGTTAGVPIGVGGISTRIRPEVQSRIAMHEKKEEESVSSASNRRSPGVLIDLNTPFSPVHKQHIPGSLETLGPSPVFLIRTPSPPPQYGVPQEQISSTFTPFRRARFGSWAQRFLVQNLQPSAPPTPKNQVRVSNLLRASNNKNKDRGKWSDSPGGPPIHREPHLPGLEPVPILQAPRLGILPMLLNSLGFDYMDLGLRLHSPLPIPTSRPVIKPSSSASLLSSSAPESRELLVWTGYSNFPLQKHELSMKVEAGVISTFFFIFLSSFFYTSILFSSWAHIPGSRSDSFPFTVFPGQERFDWVNTLFVPDWMMPRKERRSFQELQSVFQNLGKAGNSEESEWELDNIDWDRVNWGRVISNARLHMEAADSWEWKPGPGEGIDYGEGYQYENSE